MRVMQLCLLFTLCLPMAAQIKKVVPKAPVKAVESVSKQPLVTDFIIRDCRFETVGKDVRAVATLFNTGTQGASFQTGQTMALLSVRGANLLCKAPGGGYFLDRGATMEVSQLLKSVPVGAYPAIWKANPDRVVPEKDFGNNEKTCELVVAAPQGPLPDLVISSLTVQPPSGPPSTVFEFKITITNVGDAMAPGSTSLLCRLLLDGVSFTGVVGWSGYVDLAPGQSLVHTIRTNTPLAPGVHEFKARVNAGKRLIEKNEANNDASCTVTVQ
ncbi:MAG: hypothetical protein IPN59_06205 [Holophaga sp.]|nr:hypothetical protein [Holophaga sp.]